MPRMQTQTRAPASSRLPPSTPTRDEEDQNNLDDRLGGPPTPGGFTTATTAADPRSQKMFEALVRQSLQMLLSDRGVEMMIAAARSKGAEAALADTIVQVMQGVMGAAAAAGLQVPPEVAEAAAKPAVMLLVKAMRDAGFIKDPGASADQVVRAIDAALADPAGQGAPEASPGPQDPQQEEPQPAGLQQSGPQGLPPMPENLEH